jgi:glycosyltransferase involved in cell wall biosynthesis
MAMSQSRFRYTFTIFIPIYNRAHLLPRAFASIERQGECCFEVLIVDDGSTDNSREVVTAWQDKVNFSVRYYYQSNQGKFAAHNVAIEKARGFFIVILDSDDTLAPNALESLKRHWKEIPEAERHKFAGVEGLCAYLSNGKIAGDRFPEDVFDSNYLEVHHQLHLGGDKKNAIRTEVLREFPFPRFDGEKHIRESLVWNRMAHKYKFRYINEIIQYIEYQPDGLSSGIFWRRVSNPNGFRLAHLEMVNNHSQYCSLVDLYKEASKYVRYSFHSRIPMVQQGVAIKNKMLWLLALPKGTINFLLDRLRMRKGFSPGFHRSSSRDTRNSP